MASTTLLFANVGWMNAYRGPKGDPIHGNFGYLKDNKIGHESWNFAPLAGRLFGYVPGRINLKALGGSARDESIDGITVVWIARNPRTGETVVVGWYRNATIYSVEHQISRTRASDFDVVYQIAAPVQGSRLLGEDERFFKIPTEKKKGNLGQSPVWYGGTDAFRDKTRAYIEADGVIAKPKKTAVASARNPDPLARKKIEEAAIRHATAYYRSRAGGHRTVVSVERDGAGWDLEATAPNGDLLKVEVKGLSGRDVIVELTPNEYKKMWMKEHCAQYVVYIVTQAGTAHERSHVFRYEPKALRGTPGFVADDGRVIAIQELVAARLSA
jgi:hypothetical protein